MYIHIRFKHTRACKVLLMTVPIIMIKIVDLVSRFFIAFEPENSEKEKIGPLVLVVIKKEFFTKSLSPQCYLILIFMFL